MPHPLRSFVVAGSLLALSAGLAACGSSSGSDASPSPTTRATSTTVASTNTTAMDTATTTVAAGSTTTAANGRTTTTSATATELPGCQELLVEYSSVFTPDDLSGAVVFFRKYAPFMPEDVSAAVLRLADAYDDADDKLDNLDFADVDLSADAQTFSDWTNDGCPPG